MTEEIGVLPHKKAAMTWFKSTFRTKIEAAFAGTPFTLDMAAAIATQESYWLWVKFYQTLPLDQTLMLCVGDSIGEPERRDFPKKIADLLAVPRGQDMFDIARKSFEEIAAYISAYHDKLDDEPKAFCHGFGIFQYDIQFFENENPEFFLQKKWASFDECLALLKKELKYHQSRMYLAGKTTLTDREQTHLATAYNCGAGNFILERDLKQGRRDSYAPDRANDPTNKYYGQHIWNFLNVAHTIP
jgi:hypothetical protein